jgi:hypothetical protein
MWMNMRVQFFFSHVCIPTYRAIYPSSSGCLNPVVLLVTGLQAVLTERIVREAFWCITVICYDYVASEVNE